MGAELLGKLAEDFPIFFHDLLGDFHVGKLLERFLAPRHHLAGGG